ncbi:hypothetical protein [Deinococcus arcticus]|uniref:DUF4402 domain-containing protein n=1 Tax=Deinococcus arcticus TaxID=2136176 RepID=A0A2T3W9U5_9DEIO|nr:hypothetical protein [Deinococcus arcticus]PTA68681.1 hypothetical protein C8263_05370 [Deinococcus arcticus]
MRKIALLALGLTASTAAAANVAGTQTTPLNMRVQNVCITGYTNPEYNGAAGLSRTWSAVNLNTLGGGVVSAVRNVTTPAIRALGVDCNHRTALTIAPIADITMTRDTSGGGQPYSFQIKGGAWSATNPWTMAVTNGITGTMNRNMGNGNTMTYQYYERLVTFKLGGAGSDLNTAWSVPGGNYTGNLVVSFNYDE